MITEKLIARYIYNKDSVPRKWQNRLNSSNVKDSVPSKQVVATIRAVFSLMEEEAVRDVCVTERHELCLNE